MPVLFSSSTFPLLPYIVCDFLQPTAVPYIHPSSPTHTRTPLPHQPTDPHRETTPSLSFNIAICGFSSRQKRQTPDETATVDVRHSINACYSSAQTTGKGCNGRCSPGFWHHPPRFAPSVCIQKGPNTAIHPHKLLHDSPFPRLPLPLSVSFPRKTQSSFAPAGNLAVDAITRRSQPQPCRVIAADPSLTCETTTPDDTHDGTPTPAIPQPRLHRTSPT